MISVREETPEDVPTTREVNELAFGQPQEAGIVDALDVEDGKVRIAIHVQTRCAESGDVLPCRRRGVRVQVYGKDAEPPCVEALVDYLKRLLPGEHVSSRPNEDDPPDYYVDIGDTTYPAEVTSLMEQADVVGKRAKALPRAGYTAHFCDFVEEAQREAVKRGLLKGTYSVIFMDRRAYGKMKSKEVRRFILGWPAPDPGTTSSDSHPALLDNGAGTASGAGGL